MLLWNGAAPSIPMHEGVFGLAIASKAAVAWAVVAGLGDVITGGNYMHLAWKPGHGSLLSVLGPWPWYVGAAAGVGLVMLGLVKALTAGLERLLM